jgi:hypothetical protein
MIEVVRALVVGQEQSVDRSDLFNGPRRWHSLDHRPLPDRVLPRGIERWIDNKSQSGQIENDGWATENRDFESP